VKIYSKEKKNIKKIRFRKVSTKIPWNGEKWILVWRTKDVEYSSQWERRRESNFCLIFKAVLSHVAYDSDSHNPHCHLTSTKTLLSSNIWHFFSPHFPPTISSTHTFLCLLHVPNTPSKLSINCQTFLSITLPKANHIHAPHSFLIIKFSIPLCLTHTSLWFR